MSPEKRRYNRFVIENQNIHLRALVATDIELLDISSAGACIKSKRSLQLGGDYIFRLETHNGKIPLKCHVVWENLYGNVRDENDNIVPIYVTGLEFRDATPDEIDALSSFIDHFVSPDLAVKEYITLVNDKRLSGIRFKLPSPENATIKGDRTFSVRKISIGGLGVISDSRFEKDGELSFELFLSERESPIFAKGRVASCTPISAGRHRGYDVGIEFLEMSDDSAKRLVSFIHSL